jgi:hypothetical protein
MVIMALALASPTENRPHLMNFGGIISDRLRQRSGALRLPPNTPYGKATLA